MKIKNVPNHQPDEVIGIDSLVMSNIGNYRKIHHAIFMGKLYGKLTMSRVMFNSSATLPEGLWSMVHLEDENDETAPSHSLV